MQVDLAGKTIEVTGTLRFVSPEMDPVTKQVRIWAELPNKDGKLRPGQQGALEILP
ncbi:MAG: efflux RND transporter periplasmic adaptor subunit [Pirellulales bacterium]|nr:efflux RND transporter periplasmic adaptor subunit [Pirellulales bacterium]